VIADPAEQNNLAADPAFSEVKTKLKNELQKWLVSQNDFLKDENNMPLLTTQRQYRVDILSHPKNKVKLPANLKNSLKEYRFYTHKN
jgi:hypothetical protein